MPKAASSYSLHLRKDGRWTTTVSVNGDKFYLYGSSKSELLSKLRAKLYEIEEAKKARIVDVFAADRVTLKDYATEVVKTFSYAKVRPNTYAAYMSIIQNHLNGRIGRLKLSEVSAVDIQELLNEKAKSPKNPKGLAEKSLLHIKRLLSMVYNQAIKSGIMYRNPTVGVSVPKAGVKETRALTVEEQERILRAARECGHYTMFAVVLSLYTGCRKGEILGLQWKDVDFENNVIHIYKQLGRQQKVDRTSTVKSEIAISEPKTKQSVRDIYMFQSLADEFRAYEQQIIYWKEMMGYEHSKEDYVIASEHNKSIEPRVFYRHYQDVLLDAGITDINFHTLRHTFATRCIENGMDVLMVSKTLGHANISLTLNQYSHLLPEHQRASMDKLEAIYFKP